MGPPADATWVGVTYPADFPEFLTGHILRKIKETGSKTLKFWGVLLHSTRKPNFASFTLLHMCKDICSFLPTFVCHPSHQGDLVLPLPPNWKRSMSRLYIVTLLI